MEDKKKQQAGIVQLKKGDILFHQGDEEYILFKVLSGEVGLYLNYGEKTERELARMKKEQCFGEMAILEQKPRTATAVALEDCILMAYPEEYMGLFVSQNIMFTLNVMQGLSAKLRNANKEIEAMQELLLAANKEHPGDKGIDRYIRKHTQFAPDGTPYFAVKI